MQSVVEVINTSEIKVTFRKKLKVVTKTKSTKNKNRKHNDRYFKQDTQVNLNWTDAFYV